MVLRFGKHLGKFFGALVLLIGATLHASTIGIQEMSLYVHDSTGLIAQVTSGSSTFFSSLGANNVGSFGWTYTNTTAASLTNVRVFGFLDADIDASVNTYYNEYGTFISLSTPPSSSSSAIAATQWQIDEPGYVFGTIINDLLAGQLRNQNFVPSSAPDDVSLALGFSVGTLLPGQSVTTTFQISPTNIGGLEQTDPDSPYNFYFNGNAVVNTPVGPSPPIPTPTPEPGTILTVGLGLATLVLRKLRS